jgi:hypothetical protein
MPEENEGLDCAKCCMHLCDMLILKIYFPALSFLQHPSRINENSVKKRAEELQTFKLDGENLAAWLLKAVTFIDLTTLGGK